MHRCAAVFVALLVASLPLAGPSEVRSYEAASERAFDQLGADDDTHALPGAGDGARALRAQIALLRLPVALPVALPRREPSALLFAGARFTPTPIRARRGHTIPRRCVPRLPVDSPDR